MQPMKKFAQKGFGYLYAKSFWRRVGVTIAQNNRGHKYDLSFMGLFDEQKGVLEVIDILKRLKRVKPNVSLVMMGGGERESRMNFCQKSNERGAFK